MDTLAVILMIGLFILMLVFIFSTALLTPLIGKRNILFVVLVGFTVGAVGGAFFISPVIDDIPDMANSLFHATSTGTDVIQMNVSTDINITSFIENTKKIDGVTSIQSNGITVTTPAMSPDWQTTYKNRIPSINENITSLTIVNNKTMVLELKNGTNPQDVVNSLESWMMLVSGSSITYSVANVTLTVQASKLNQVKSQLPQGEIIITNVSGPTENNVEAVRNLIPNKNNIIIFCGFLGMIVGLAGLFIDSISGVLEEIRNRIKEFRRK
jgi:hypothetical protein